MENFLNWLPGTADLSSITLNWAWHSSAPACLHNLSECLTIEEGKPGRMQKKSVWVSAES